MRIILLALFLAGSALSAQNVKLTTLLKDQISIRAIQIWNGKIWYAGTDSKFGFVNLKNSKDQGQIRLSHENLQFRTLAQNDDDFFAINIESPAQLFKINKENLAVKPVFNDSRKDAFYDALQFVNDKTAYGFSDSETGQMVLLTTDDGGQSWKFSKAFDEIKLQKGEAAFAASNSNIAGKGNYVWLATGGMKSRIFRLKIRRNKLPIAQVFNTPFVQGSGSQGIYSIDFANEKFGIAVGGDYTKQDENRNNIATTNDGGQTWQIQASGKNGGYMTCVKIKPGSRGKEIIAVGDQQISYSKDFGKTWKVISKEKNLYVCEWLDSKTVVFAGLNRIVKMTFES